MTSYLSSKVERRASPCGGEGLFAREWIRKEEVVTDFSKGSGQFLSVKEYEEYCRRGFDYGIQVGDDIIFAPTNEVEREDADFLNHSCDPNCGIQGSLKIVAMRDIGAGEEITFDYAMSESSRFEMTCHCGSPNCRGTITGEDWKREDLQKRYQGYFSEYLGKRINHRS